MKEERNETKDIQIRTSRQRNKELQKIDNRKKKRNSKRKREEETTRKKER